MKRQCGRGLLQLALAVALVAGVCRGAEAQLPATGTVAGAVRDDAGHTLADVLVTLTDSLGGVTRVARTDHTGTFRFPHLWGGRYDLLIERLTYAPHRVAGVRVSPGTVHQVEARLVPLGSAAMDGDAVDEDAAGLTPWATGRALRAWPGATRRAPELNRLFSRATDDLIVDGLPAQFTLLSLDGVPFRPAAHPWTRGLAHSMALPVGALTGVGLVTEAADVRWIGAAAGYLAYQLDRSGTRGSIEAHGAVGLETGTPAPEPDPGIDGAVHVRSGQFADGARLSVGADIGRTEHATGEAWEGTAGIEQLRAAAAARGVELAGPQGLGRERSVSGYARLDWPLSERHDVGAWLLVASLPALTAEDPDLRLTQSLEGLDIIAGAALQSALGRHTGNDLRASYTSSRRTADTAPVPATVLATDRLAFGGVTVPIESQEDHAHLSDAVQFSTGGHTLQVGGSLRLGRYRIDARDAADGEFLFGSIDDFQAGTGVLIRAQVPTGRAEWNTTGFGAWIQDTWSPFGGLDVRVGARVDRDPLPRGEVRPDDEWVRLAGIPNNAADGKQSRLSARFGLDWDVQRDRRWLVQLAGGVDYDRIDPLLIAQWITDAGTVRVSRTIGDVAWPVTTGGAAPTARLTVLPREFDAPRTARISGGTARALSGGTTLSAAGTFRRTENLPRAADLNLLPLPAFTDQYGGPVFGTPVRAGGIIAAQPGSSRRFDTYDQVLAIASDGYSDHWNVTVGLEQTAARGVDLIARYTFGQTRDNWFGARERAGLTPLPQGIDAEGEWAEGVSDFDVPHRLVTGVALEAPRFLISALYRLQSGLPFTPRFAYGIDANADGALGNDIAFIDPELPGMTALLSEWSCLRESSGRVAERNACRAPMRHTVDVSAAARIVRTERFVASITVDGYDLLDREQRLPDAALYVLDPDGSLTVDPVSRSAVLPIMVNPTFGQPAGPVRTARRFRVGISLKW